MHSNHTTQSPLRSLLCGKGLVLLALVLALALAATACSVETRQEREQRLAQESGQQAAPAGDKAQGLADRQHADMGQNSGEGQNSSQAHDSGQDSGQGLTQKLLNDAVQEPDSSLAPGAPGADAQPMTPMQGSSTYQAALQALDQHPEAVVHAFFTQVMNGDLAVLEPLVAKDQQQELKELLAYLEEQKQLPENALQGVDKVEFMQTTLTAVVDVNVTVQLESGPRTTAESIELIYEDGAWKLANLDF